MLYIVIYRSSDSMGRDRWEIEQDSVSCTPKTYTKEAGLAVVEQYEKLGQAATIAAFNF